MVRSTPLKYKVEHVIIFHANEFILNYSSTKFRVQTKNFDPFQKKLFDFLYLHFEVQTKDY